MANPQLYEAALEKFRNTYGMPEYDLKKMETIDMQFAFINSTDGSTAAEKFVRLAASTAKMYFESLTNLQTNGTRKLKGFNASKFLREFEELAKAKYESELEGEDKGDREPYAGANKEAIKKALEARANEFNKPLATLWKDQMKSGQLKIENARLITSSLFKKLTDNYAKKEEFGNELRDIVAAREAMRQLRESRKGFFGFFWKIFNSDQNSQEKDLLVLIERSVIELQGSPYHYDVDGVFREATQETPWEEIEFYRTNAEDFSADKRPEEELAIPTEEKAVRESISGLKEAVDGKAPADKSDPVIDDQKLDAPSLETK